MSIATRYNGRGMRQLILSGMEPPSLTSHPRYGYLRQAYLSVLHWVDREELRWLHWCARGWSRVMGVEYVLDHIVPLNHPYVCGLTVPWNLRLLTRDANATKGGHWSPDQLEMDYEMDSWGISGVDARTGVRGGADALPPECTVVG